MMIKLHQGTEDGVNNGIRKISEVTDIDTEGETRNKLLKEFGINLGPMGNDIYHWLWPEINPTSKKRNKKRLKYIDDGGYFPSTIPALPTKGSVSATRKGNEYNKNLHRYILHNYASEKLVWIYKRIAFYMRLSPRILNREIAALTGRLGINILQPQEEDFGPTVRADVACLRRVKAKVYCLLGLKLMKYHLLLMLRYIRLGIPPEIRERYISDILTRSNIAKACLLKCNKEYTNMGISSQDEMLSPKQHSSLKLTYPNRLEFTSQGYPYSSYPLYKDVENGWSPSELVHPHIFHRLSEGSRCKLVYIAAALHPEYCLQLVKNVAFCAGYKTEKELLQKFCLNSTFGSRGAKAFISKLKEEKISHGYIKKAVCLATGLDAPKDLRAAELILSNIPLVAGLVKRHIDSGHKVMPVATSRMIYKRLRRNSALKPDHLLLWDIMRETILRRVPKAPLYIYKQARMELFSDEVYTSPVLGTLLEKRGLDVTDLFDLTQQKNNCNGDTTYLEKRRIAKQMRMNLKSVWHKNAGFVRSDLERVGLEIIDAMAMAAGYEGINNILVLASLLSEKSGDTKEWRSRQPGPDFEHSASLELKDFKYKLTNYFGRNAVKL
ncbi:hypothetical protein BgAZ_304160 [Babesia gibsoni]|uniref:Uncharacterized protein n=1 Tax=Babesia gibsoni TaxID=33632 RepID=A0AAD8LNV6_BABGI|nr:hypothetical protein BgAZ_304160 [Babesia gibsoni]